MDISLPDDLKAFVNDQVSPRGYGSSREYVCELIRSDRDQQQLPNRLLAGASSAPAALAEEVYFDGLRDRVRRPGNVASETRSQA